MRPFWVERSNASRGGLGFARAAAAGVALACWLSPGPATAQASGACTPDTSTVAERLVLGLSPDGELDSAARALTATVAVQIASFVEPPARLTIDRPRGPSEWKDASGTYRSEGLLSIGLLALDLSPTGRAQRLTLDPGTGSPEVDHALLAAVAAADSGGVFPPAANGVGDPRRVRLWLLTATKPPATWAASLFLVAGRAPAKATPAVVQSQLAPTYPQALLTMGVEGDAYLAFEVDEQGHVPESSIRVLSADDAAFVEPAKQSVREAHFVAATQGGCPVPVTLRQRVRFRPPATASATGAGPLAADSGANPTDKEAVLAEEARWLAANLPKLATTTPPLPSSRVVSAKLDHCTLAIERHSISGAQVHYAIPLRGVDPGSLSVQQHPPRGPGGGLAIEQPWRVILELSEGAIGIDAYGGGRTWRTYNSELDLFVSNREAGLAIAVHLQAAVMACR